MNEEILRILSMIKNGVMDENDAAELLEAMYSSEKTEREEKQTTVIRNYLPWDDDGKLRIVAFTGHSMIKAEEAYEKYRFSVDLSGASLEAASCCGDIACGDVNGKINCGGSINCGGITGDVNCGGGITCDDIDGDANCGGGITCDIIEGNASCGGGITCDSIEGDVKCGGDIFCDNIAGDVECRGNITCGKVSGEAKAEGKKTGGFDEGNPSDFPIGGLDLSGLSPEEIRNFFKNILPDRMLGEHDEN